MARCENIGTMHQIVESARGSRSETVSIPGDKSFGRCALLVSQVIQRST